MLFYHRLNALCAENGLSVSRLLEILEISKSSASRWKTRGFEPSPATAKKIADYFGITVRELMDEQKENAPAPKNEDDELVELREQIRRNPDLKILFSLSKNVTPAELRKAVKMIKTMWGDDDE